MIKCHAIGIVKDNYGNNIIIVVPDNDLDYGEINSFKELKQFIVQEVYDFCSNIWFAEFGCSPDIIINGN